MPYQPELYGVRSEPGGAIVMDLFNDLVGGHNIYVVAKEASGGGTS